MSNLQFFSYLILDPSTVAERDDVEWEDVIDTSYKVVVKELGSTAFHMTLARTLDILGLYKVL